jgi:hypothetical protein
MMFSPELDAMQDLIKVSVLRESEVVFDDPADKANLQVTIRIACEFRFFLQQSNDPPELSEADYMAGTIRSGLDSFFSMAQIGRILTGLELRTGFDKELPCSFSTLKGTYESVFQELLSCTQSAKAIGLLLSLVQIMLLFLTAYFPSFSSFSRNASSR